MSDHTKRVKTQWNSYVRPFDSFSDDEINGLLGFCSDTTKVAEDLSGKQCYLAYGALLGFEREGKLIAHDFDIDVAIDCGRASKDEVAEICRKLMVSFTEAGYEVKAKCFAQFFVLPPPESGQRYKVEFFASWIEKEKYYLYFALPGVDIVNDIFPLQTVELQGHPFYAPKNASALLAATYGEDWEIPNSNFKYEMNGERWAPFTSYFYSRNVKQWDDFYASSDNSPMLNRAGSFPVEGISTDSSITVLDVGCGVGANSLGLAKAGHGVVAIDASNVAIERLEQAKTEHIVSNLSAKKISLYDVYECEKLGLELEKEVDLVLVQDVLNHISLVGETTLLRLANRVLASSGKMIITIPTEHIVAKPEDAVATEANKKLGLEFYTRKICVASLKKSAMQENLNLTESKSQLDDALSQFVLSPIHADAEGHFDGAVRKIA